MTKTLITLAAALLLCGCGVDENQKLNVEQSSASRFEVSRVGAFHDDMSSENMQRGIYVLRDRKTGHEYVGISGVGISEIDDAKSGATAVSGATQ